jgi:hypothetical protein
LVFFFLLFCNFSKPLFAQFINFVCWCVRLYCSFLLYKGKHWCVVLWGIVMLSLFFFPFVMFFFFVGRWCLFFESCWTLVMDWWGWLCLQWKIVILILKKKSYLFLLSCPHQTHNRISVYPVYIISYFYPVSYPIMSLSYHDHQTGPKGLK